MAGAQADVWEDKAQISEVLIRYATGIDRRDWELFRSIWADDAVSDYGRGFRFHGPDEVTEYMIETHRPMGATQHRMTNMVIEVDGDRATARTYAHVVLMVDKNDPTAWMDVIAHYDDVFVRTPDGWRISERKARQSRRLTSG